MSYLSRHRTICEVLYEISTIADAHGEEKIITLCKEALTYAQSMSNKLQRYKQQEEAKHVDVNPNANPKSKRET